MRARSCLVAIVVAAAGAIAGCGGGDGSSSGTTITVWSLENQPDRLAATIRTADRWSEKSGIKVKVKGIDEDQLQSLITSSAAAGTLPDVIAALPLSYSQTLAAQRITDPQLADAVVAKLGRSTFSKRALALITVDGKAVAVPSDGWGQIIFYRKDLFENAGLAPPTTYDALQKAAATLQSQDMAGIALPTTSGDTFTQESFESFALANDCQLVDDAGKVSIDSPQCLRALTFYTDLAKRYSVPGAQDVSTTRATYFAGKAAMVVWSSFLLDELAGLRKDEPPACPQCRSDPEFLAHNTGVVTMFQGPDATRPAQYGDLVSWAITRGANDSTPDFVQYMMSDGYEAWLGLAPEGKVPVRLGTAQQPDRYSDAWSALKAGVDEKALLKTIYPADVIDAVRAAPERFDRWGYRQGQGRLVGAELGVLPLPKAISEVTGGQTTPKEGLSQAQGTLEELQASAK
jgi:multiple sugar transport system substrate-binding protein